MSSGNLTDRDRAILAHLGRFRLSLKEIVGELFFDGRDPQKALDALRKEELIRAMKGFGGNRSYYQLTRKGAGVAGVPARRADELGSEAVLTHLAVLAFCFLRKRARIRLEEAEMRELFEDAPPSGRCHCLEHGLKTRRLYHVYVPGDSTPVTDVVRAAREHIVAVHASPNVEPWLANRVYSHAILVETESRAAELKAAFDEARFDERRPLRQVGHLLVDRVAGVSTLEESLRVLA